MTCKKKKEKTTRFGVNLKRSHVLYWAAIIMTGKRAAAFDT